MIGVGAKGAFALEFEQDADFFQGGGNFFLVIGESSGRRYRMSQ